MRVESRWSRRSRSRKSIWRSRKIPRPRGRCRYSRSASRPLRRTARRGRASRAPSCSLEGPPGWRARDRRRSRVSSRVSTIDSIYKTNILYMLNWRTFILYLYQLGDLLDVFKVIAWHDGGGQSEGQEEGHGLWHLVDRCWLGKFGNAVCPLYHFQVRPHCGILLSFFLTSARRWSSAI